MNARSQVVELAQFIHSDEGFHMARVNITSSQDLSLHSHNYAEIFWVEKGAGYHHVNGGKVKISAGDMVMMRPSDTHTFSPIGRGLTIVNVAFPADTLAFLRSRYFENSQIYFWTTGLLPYQTRLSLDLIWRISARAEEMMKTTRSRLQLDSLMLFIFRRITLNEIVPPSSDLPLWLFNAIQRYNSSDQFAEGITAFIELCERNTDYVNRVVKKYFGKSLTGLINDFRMQYASTQLTVTKMPIKEICTNCGFTNLGHFYRTFCAAYGLPPKQYRNLHQKIV